jgi:hypothetical protein
MKKNHLTLLGLLIVIFLTPFLNSCKKYKQGVLEIKTTRTYANSVETFYRTVIVEDGLYDPETEFVYSSNPSLSEVKTGYYWPNESANSLGYKHICSVETPKYYTAENECDSGKPGANGHWKNDLNTGGSGGNSSCGSSYVSPLANPSLDVQLDAYCAAAYAYRCLDGKPLSDPGVQATCANYNTMKEPSAPDCPYCR